jgi:hypothetical protein
VGFFGLNLTTINESKKFSLNINKDTLGVFNTTPYNVNTNTLYSGVDWLYSYVETLYIYDYNVVYFWLLNNIYDESMDFIYISLWFLSLQTISTQLFWSIILDNYVIDSIIQLKFSDEWVRGFISGKESSLFVVHHPETLFIKNQINNNFLNSFLTNTNISIIQYLDNQSLSSPVMLLPQLLFISYMFFFFISFYFSFYSSSSKEESTIDADYLSASLTVESEKEIGSLDDILMPFIIIIYTFGWYFYIYC